MPVDAQIPLSIKPAVLPEVDFNKTFLTLGQLRNLQAEQARTEAQAALAGTQGQAAQDELAATRRLRAIPTMGAVPTGGPAFDDRTLGALAQGESTPAVPAPRRLTTEELAAQYVAADPIKGPELAKALFANDKQALDMRLQHATFASNAFKDANNQAEWNIALAYIEHVTGKTTEHLPQVYSPEAKAQMANVGRSVQQEIEQKNKERELSEQLVLKGFPRDILTPRYPGGSSGGGPTFTPVPGTEPPLSGGETAAAANFAKAAQSNARLAGIEAEIASGGTDPKIDPNAQTPAERDRELQQYLENTPQRTLTEFIDTNRLPVMDPAMRSTNAPNTYTGKGLIRIVPSVAEHTLATNASGVTTALGGVVGGVVGSVGGPGLGTAVGGAVGNATGAGVGPTVNAAANTLLDPRRQAYYGEQLNFIAAVKGDHLTPDGIELERKRFFPQPGDTEPEVLRKRQVREEALSGMATQTNRPQGTVPIGQTRETPAAPQKSFTMDDVHKAARVTGRTVDEVLADVKRQRIVIR